MPRPRTAGAALSLAAFLAGCCAAPAPPQPKPYQPRTEGESRLLAESRRDIFPDDVRADLQAHAAETLAWTGILRAVEIEGTTVRLSMEHHYWDWIEDRGDGLAALSPRGEGTYECRLELLSLKDAEDYRTRTPPTGRMVITYAVPTGVTAKGVVQLRCRRLIPFREGRYSTDLLDYGREGVSPPRTLPPPGR